MESPRALLGKISWRLSATKLMIKITNSALLSSIIGARLCLQWGQCKTNVLDNLFDCYEDVSWALTWLWKYESWFSMDPFSKAHYMLRSWPAGVAFIGFDLKTLF